MELFKDIETKYKYMGNEDLAYNKKAAFLAVIIVLPFAQVLILLLILLMVK
ncbi:hypothetical protein SAMN05446037_10371 [Anaerovirgula multivorans]|uniref:Uncharacterized protein n=1 Tax=Anaerovirgula multivorans TaxID=312168 RepID=A0A239JMM3_9FIRM|nr:hypothetical protein [Anaerovirgula multivorans]SNT06792.1 hypothetical protein SAMN05446037_10371 [Anaerovirgula multivorans]